MIYLVYILVQYCAKVTQAKCANFVLCSRELSRKVRAKVWVTIWRLLSEISLEQRTLFRWLFGTKRNFTIKSVVSLTWCPKFRIRQTQQFSTWSLPSTGHITYRMLNNQSEFSSEISQLTIEKSELSLAMSGLVSVHRELSFEISGGIKQ